MSELRRVALTTASSSTRIGFGCAGLMRDPSRKRRQEVLAAAYEHGVRHFDVARMYGLGVAERELGRFAAGRREQLVLVSKFGIEASSAPAGLARLQAPARRLLARFPALRRFVKARSGALHVAGRYDPQSARRSLETSLRELGTDHLDVLLLHDPPPAQSIALDELSAYLQSARDAGYIGAWGVAGEYEDSAELEAQLPGSSILQVRSDVLAPVGASTRARTSGLITFGVLSTALPRIAEHLTGSPERLARWSEEVGIDCSDPLQLARLLLTEASSSNPNGVVLFSTTKPERLASLGELVAEEGVWPEAVAALRRLVAEELRSLPGVL